MNKSAKLNQRTVGKAREVPTEVKAAFLCGMYNGFKDNEDEHSKRFVAELTPHAITAAQVAFGDGAFNPISVWEMEAFYDRVVANCEASGSPN
jgi:hypothetical protein